MELPSNGGDGERPIVGDRDSTTESTCRNCDKRSCDGACWGFHGLARTKKLLGTTQQQQQQRRQTPTPTPTQIQIQKRSPRVSSSIRPSKLLKRQTEIAEIKRFHLSVPSSTHRSDLTSIRSPPPFVRIFQTTVKGRWCGKSVSNVLRSEFSQFANDDNGEESSLLKDVLSRSFDTGEWYSDQSSRGVTNGE